MLTGIPILNYHRLLPESSANCLASPTRFSISVQQFVDQLRQIHDIAAQSCLLTDLWRNDSSWGKAGSLILTFDDGRDSDYYTAYPQLVEAGDVAEFFVNTATIGTPGFLSWAQISEMRRSGMSFQSHGHDHVDLTLLGTSELKKQLLHSRQLLEDQTGSPVRFLAAPYGRINRRVIAEASEAGYWAVCTSGWWPAGRRKFLLPRVPIYGHTSVREFRSLVLLRANCYVARAIRSALLSIPKYLALTCWPQWVQKWREQSE